MWLTKPLQNLINFHNNCKNRNSQSMFILKRKTFSSSTLYYLCSISFKEKAKHQLFLKDKAFLSLVVFIRCIYLDKKRFRTFNLSNRQQYNFECKCVESIEHFSPIVILDNVEFHATTMRKAKKIVLTFFIEFPGI